MGVPGVANVAIWGMRDQQLQVQVDPERLRDRNVTLNQVIETAGNAQVVSPLSFLEGSTPGTGGFIETPQQRLQVRNVLDQIADPKRSARSPSRTLPGGSASPTSRTSGGHQPLIGDAVVDDGDGLLLVVEKFPGASTLEVTNGVEEALDELRPGLAGLRTDTSIFRPATLIEDAIDNLTADADRRRPAPGVGARRLPVRAGAPLLIALVDDSGGARGSGARARPAGRDLQRDLLRWTRRRRSPS